MTKPSADAVSKALGGHAARRYHRRDQALVVKWGFLQSQRRVKRPAADRVADERGASP